MIKAQNTINTNIEFKKHLYKIVSMLLLSTFLLVLYSHIQNSFLKGTVDSLEKRNIIFLNFITMRQLQTDMETGLRGFVIEKEEAYLAPYTQAELRLDVLEEKIFKDLTDEYLLAKYYRDVIEKFNSWKKYSKDIIAVVKENPDQADRYTKQGKLLFDDLRMEADAFERELNREILMRRGKLDRFDKYSLGLELVYSGLIVIFLIYFLIKQIRNLISNYSTLLKENERNLRKIEDASKAKDLFLANMSHEIRTPLGAIIGFSEIVAKDPALSQESKSHISFVKRNSKHLLSLINDLFDISKIVAKKLEVKSEQVEISTFVEDLDNMFASQVNDKKIDLSLKTSKNIPQMIKTDKTRLTQVLSNLIGNAVKFTPEKGKIDVLITFEDESLIVDVIDSGIGIEKSHQHLIFEAFNQGDDTHSRQYGGAGLGLAISQKLASLIGGDIILVSSKRNVGSHFRFVLEVSERSSERLNSDEVYKDDHSLSNYDNSNVSLVSYDFSEKKILLAEDSKENQILFKVYIESTGAQLEVVENGSEAVRKILSGEKFDLVLLDIQMPGMDGYEALKILREANYAGNIIALTAHALKGVRDKCLRLGFNDYVSKPVTQPALLTKINLYLSEEDYLN